MATGFRPSVYVASQVRGLASVLKSSAPNIDVIDVPLDEAGKCSDKDKTTINTRAEVLLADVPVILDVFYTAKKLKWAQSTWAGVNPLIQGLDSRKNHPNIQVTRTGKGFGSVMSEYVLGYILAKERGFFQMYEDQKARRYDQKKYSDFRFLPSLRIGILGAGQIGSEIGSLCKQMGMEVWVLSRQQRPEHSMFDAHRTPNQLPEFLQNCDYICSVLPSTPATRGLLAGDVLENCKERKSTLINVGRGDVIDEGSLAKAIKNNWISGAILDVFEKEPLPEDSILWSLPNVIITPHISGPSFSKPVADAFLENYQNYVEGKPLNVKVDFDKGY